MAPTVTPYDSVPYPDLAFVQTHPDRLATIATLFGVQAARPDSCRVLELGCGSGGNLIPMAATLPNSQFLGVDLASTAINLAKERTRRLGLSNVEFHCADLLTWAPPQADYDYIIGHGLFSWVPEPVRLAVLSLCDRYLAPRGIAYLSYNVYPGCHIRKMLAEILQFHTQGFGAPEEKIEQAQSMLKLMLAAQTKVNEFSAFLKHEAEWILDRASSSVLYHDDLAEFNQPYYFHQFMALAHQHHLQYVGESDLHEMQDHLYPEPVVNALKQLGNHRVMKEQYLDFLKCRRFRQTLLCRAGLVVQDRPHAKQIPQYSISAQVKPVSEAPDLSPGIVEKFEGPRGGTMQIDQPLTKAAMLELRAQWPRPIAFFDLVRFADARLGAPIAAGAIENRPEVEEFAEVILAAAWAGLLELHAHPPAWSSTPSERPVLSPVARLQLEPGPGLITTLRHTGARIDDPVTRKLLLLLDGTRTLTDLVEEIRQFLTANTSKPLTKANLESVPRDVEKVLHHAAQQGFLSG